jgi:hypothetical protein
MPLWHPAASLRFLALLACEILGVTSTSAAQGRVTTVSLPGIVRDTTGLVLPGATVELRRQAEPMPIRPTVSAADGTFLIPDLNVGAYRLRVSFPAFDVFDQTLMLDANSPRPLIVVLALSGLQEHVSVVGAGIDLPTTATMQTDVSRRLIETLPSESVSAGGGRELDASRTPVTFRRFNIRLRSAVGPIDWTARYRTYLS